MIQYLHDPSPPPPPRRPHVLVHKRLFWWSAHNPSEPLAELDSHSYVRSFTREGAIEKARKKWSRPKPSKYEIVEL